jgi:hypothetical protein
MAFAAQFLPMPPKGFKKQVAFVLKQLKDSLFE